VDGETRNAYRILVGKSRRKRSLGRLRRRRRWVDDINMDARKTRFEDDRWIELAQNRVNYRELL
jgi:hypothetical protein